MNERIQELIEECTDRHFSECSGGFETFDKEKFAELIVRECIQVAVNKDSGYMHPANVAGYMAAGRSTAAQMIREHFGVES
jgi:hypothetical protein